jgi:aminoglycoside 6-adenylyltransferase
MRTEKEMFDLILSVASNDERIRAVYMNGSRANPNVSKDIYQDYDIVYVVTETKWFLENKNWISVLGDLAIVQEPDSNDFGWGMNMDFTRSYTWLMLFKDGVRIDLNIQIKDEMLKRYSNDSLTVPLLDKDNCLPKIPEPSDKGYYVKKPSHPQYKGCCNEFWWCLQNVAKGIARDQLPYAMWMYNVVVRDMLTKMIDWYIGINTDFSVSVGMSGKYYKKYLPENIYSLFTKTYSGSDYNDLWTAIFNACEMFRIIAPPVGKHFGFTYNQEEDTNMMEYLNMVKASCQNKMLGSKQNTVGFGKP